MKLAIVIPTYQRLEKLKRCIASIFAGSYKDFDIWVYADGNDVYNANEIMRAFYRHGNIMCQINSTHKYVIGSWNHFAKHFIDRYDCMAWIVDDVELDPQCLTEAMKVMGKMFPDTDGMVGISQRYPGYPEVKWRENGQCIIGRKFIERFPDNQICCPNYQHFYQDEEVLEYANSIHKFALCTSATLVHHHPAFYVTERDDTHKIVRGDIMKQDKKIYNARKAKGLVWGKSWELINA